MGDASGELSYFGGKLASFSSAVKMFYPKAGLEQSLYYTYYSDYFGLTFVLNV